jgi:DivIVA domain-containing protein
VADKNLLTAESSRHKLLNPVRSAPDVRRTPMDSLAESVEGRSFDLGRRGYDRAQVDRFLTEIGASIALLEENLRDTLIYNRELERRRLGNREAEDSVETAYVAAAEAKHKLLTDAQERAALILRDAEIDSARLLAEPRAAAEQARKDAEGLLLQAQARLDAANEEAATITQESESIRAEATRLGEIELAAASSDAERARAEADAEADRLIDAARTEAEGILAESTSRASEVYEAERRRAIERFAQSRDEYEDLARRLRALKEATGDMLTNALRDYKAIRVVLDESSVEVG